MNNFLSPESLFINPSPLCQVLLDSNSYQSFDENMLTNKIELDSQKTYEIASSNFFDFNQHVYDDINHMNSISCGIYFEMTLITFRLFVWGSKGEGYEIFKHILRRDEITSLNSMDDVKAYISTHLLEFKSGITSTYPLENINLSFEKFGQGIESKQLPLANLLQFMSIDNNLNDFSK